MIVLKRGAKPALYHQLYQEMKKEILRGQYKNTHLPPIRILAKELDVSINTVNQAYAQLLAEGYIYSKPGAGYFANTIEELFAGAAFDSAAFSLIDPRETDAEPSVSYDLRYGNLSSRFFLWKQWRECIDAALYLEESREMIRYGMGQGAFPLRQELAKMLYQTRGVHCQPEQIVICAGLQNALSLLTELLPAKQFQIGFEEPGYHKSRDVFLRQGYQIFPIPVDETGMSMEHLYRFQCSLLYLTPSHQFPMGYVLPISQRVKILNYMQQIGGYIIEDDYDSEFRYKSMPIPSLQSLDQADQVIYIGTFSKSLSPNIRVAYLVLPRRLCSRYWEKTTGRSSWVSETIQYTLAEFLKRGYYERQVRKFVQDCEKKYSLVISLFKKYAPEEIRLIANTSGLHFLFELDSRLSESQLVDYFMECGIWLSPTSQYWYCQDRCALPTLQMGFAALDVDLLEEAVLHLFHSFTALEEHGNC